MNRLQFNRALNIKCQEHSYNKFREPHHGLKLKNRRICAIKEEDGSFLFKFEIAHKWRKNVMCIRLSVEAVASMAHLIDAINHKEYLEETK